MGFEDDDDAEVGPRLSYNCGDLGRKRALLLALDRDEGDLDLLVDPRDLVLEGDLDRDRSRERDRDLVRDRCTLLEYEECEGRGDRCRE